MRKLQHVLTILFIGLFITFTSAQTQYNKVETARLNNSCPTTDLSASLTVPTADDVLLIVVASGSWQPASVTYNSQTLTKFAEMHNKDASGFHVTAGLYYLKLGNVATDITSDVTVSWSGASTCFQTITASVFTNVNQTTPLNNQDSTHYTDGTTAPSLDISSTANDMVMDFMIGKKDGTFSGANLAADGSQTEIADLLVKPSSSNSNNKVRVGTSYELSTGATTTMSWSVIAGLTTQLQVGVNIQSAGVLPVELVNFQVVEYEEEVVLHWQTASERINEGFEIERSQDGEYWKNIGFVAGHGTTTESQDYSFSDYEPIIGQSYYLLKQIDYDGTFEYSNVVAVNYENGAQNVNLQFFPNPVVNELNITDGKGLISIYNNYGQLVKQITNHQSTLTINLNDLSKGQYILHIQQQNGNVMTKQFVK